MQRMRFWNSAVRGISAVIIGGACASFGQSFYFVNGSCGDDAWSGTRPECVAPDGPKLTIQAAVDVANSSDHVIVADGTYRDAGNVSIDFGGRDLVLRSENGPENCVIDGRFSDRALHFHQAETSAAVVEGFTIEHCWSASGQDGGAILCDGSSPTIRGCRFLNNRSRDDGGALANTNAHPTVQQCLFEGNIAADTGGAIDNRAGSRPSIDRCQFIRNTTARAGGAMRNWESAPDVRRCTFVENSAGEGGGIANRDGTLELTECAFQGNVATNRGGGGVSSLNTTLFARDCEFGGNTSDSQGGAIDNVESHATFIDCRITDNRTFTVGGGGMNSIAGSTTLIGCVIARNTVTGGNGGGLRVFGEATTLRQCVIVDNFGITGAGIAVGGDTTMVECVFIGNQGRNGGAINRVVGAVVIDRCVFSGNQARLGGGIIDERFTGLIVRNCLFAGNTADFGGAILTTDARISNCTFSENVALFDGGALFNISNVGATVIGGILWGDRPDEIEDTSGQTRAEFSNVQGGWPGAGNLNTPPRFAIGSSAAWSRPAVFDQNTEQTTFFDDNAQWALHELTGTFLNPQVATQPLQSLVVSNTETTATVWGDFAALGQPGNTYRYFDYRLMRDSPCVDAGDPNLTPPGGSDLKGHMRVWDGDQNGTAVADMGAYEYGSHPFGDMNCDHRFNGADIDLFFLALANPVAYTALFPNCDPLLGDMNSDGRLDGGDIDPFFACLGGGACP